MTVHKVQGMTRRKVVFDPKDILSSAYAYVALSRVSDRNNIILANSLSLPETPTRANLRKTLLEEWERLDTKANETTKHNSRYVAYMQAVAIT